MLHTQLTNALSKNYMGFGIWMFSTEVSNFRQKSNLMYPINLQFFKKYLSAGKIYTNYVVYYLLA